MITIMIIIMMILIITGLKEKKRIGIVTTKD